jgi:hypothetical protein
MPKALGMNFTLNDRSIVEGSGLPANQRESDECGNHIRDALMNGHDGLRRI